MLWEPSTYTWLGKCEFLFCKEPGDLAKANILGSICAKWSAILEHSSRQSNWGSLSETLQPRKGIWIFSGIKQRNGQEKIIWNLEKLKMRIFVQAMCITSSFLCCCKWQALSLNIECLKWSVTALRIVSSETTIEHVFYWNFSTSIGMTIWELVQESWEW